MPSNSGHALFRQRGANRPDKSQNALTRRGEGDEHGDEHDTYRVEYRTRPGGPMTHMDIKAESSWAAKQIAMSRGVQSIESVRALD